LTRFLVDGRAAFERPFFCPHAGDEQERIQGLSASRRGATIRTMAFIDPSARSGGVIRAPARRFRFARRSALAATLALSAACAGVEPAPTPVAPANVEALIGDAACDSDAQCRTIGVGAKACGGPQAYLAWSSKRTDGAALQQAAERQARAARAAAEASGIMSNCMVTKDPGAFCAASVGADGAPTAGAQPARRCRLRAGGPGGAGSIY
jgi:hypothetical protein